MNGYAEVKPPMGESRGDVQWVVRMLGLGPLQEMSWNCRLEVIGIEVAIEALTMGEGLRMERL